MSAKSFLFLVSLLAKVKVGLVMVSKAIILTNLFLDFGFYSENLCVY